MKIILALAFLVMAATSASAEMASWYGSESGSRTANGERFNPNAPTCAHRTLHFGTLVRVTYKGRSAVCRVTDRGPASWTHRSIDLSRATAQAIGMIHAGVANVSIKVIR